MASVSMARISSRLLVPRDQYVAANSLTHGSRAFSFLAGTDEVYPLDRNPLAKTRASA